MKTLYIFLLLFALALTAFAQSACQDVGDPYGYYSGMNQCVTAYSCQNECGAFAEVWYCGQVFGGPFPDTVYANPVCEGLCGPGACLSGQAPAASVKTAPSWRFDVVKVVMNLFPRYLADWEPYGTRGACVRVKKTALTGPVKITGLPRI